MATLIDTSALVVLLRRAPPPERQAVGGVAAAELRGRSALISAVTVSELLIGARDRARQARLFELLSFIAAVPADRKISEAAGRMGRAARAAGIGLPVPHLLIAATARHLGVPLLTCDPDFDRGERLARLAGRSDPWYGFRLHPSSVVG